MLPFADREDELRRVARAFRRPGGALVCLVGRRRLGKSRLLLRALAGRPSVYFVGDTRDAALQIADLATACATLVPGFADVRYPDWSALLERWWRDAPHGAVLALDELPWLVQASPELPAVLQRLVDRGGRAIALAGSSTRMMYGLLLDASAPLFGRASELLSIGPLPLGALAEVRGLDPAAAVEEYARWGGVPRYWELAAEHRDSWTAIRREVLEPLGVLHREPERLLRDEVGDSARMASVLALVGRGCHRMSEIASRLELPATSVSRPLAVLLELGFLVREIPFGRTERDTKRTLYRLGDPFLAFWYRYVDPNRSRLGAGQAKQVLAGIRGDWAVHLRATWEVLCRARVPALRIAGRRWRPASRWWGRGTDGEPLELDVVARSTDDPRTVLVGEAKLRCTADDVPRLLDGIRARAARCPELAGAHVKPVVFALDGPRRTSVVTALTVVG